jgi:hypothetical protein
MTYRNADTRIREAFAALRAEVWTLFGDAPDKAPSVLTPEASHFMAMHYLDQAQDRLHHLAKQPASEG